MPRGPDGTFSLVPGTLVSTGDTIEVSQHNPPFLDVAQALTNSLDRDGTGGMRANLNAGGFNVTNMAAGSAAGDAVNKGQLDAVASGGLPVGAPIFWFSAVIPSKFIPAYGQAISRATYAELFAVYGTQFGPGDGSTTFNLPDCRGVALVGLDNMGGAPAGRTPAASTLGGVIGADSVTLTIDQIPSHNHGGLTGASGAHDHTTNYFLGSPAGGTPGALIDTGTLGSPVATSAVGDHTHGIAAEGGGSFHNNVQPSMGLLILVKAIS